MNTNSSNAGTWLAIALSAIALIFAVAAYNRSGIDLETQLQNQYEQAARNLALQAARIEASAQLAALQVRQEARQDLNELQAETAEIRRDLNQAYREARLEATQEFREIDTQFEQLENAARAGSAEALGDLENLIQALRQDVRTDEPEAN